MSDDDRVLMVELLELALAQQQQLAAQQQALARIERLLDARSPLAPADQERLAGWLPVWAGVLGSSCVKARQVIEHPNPGLQLALGGISAKALGKLLSRAAGHPVGGLVVERVADEDGAALWSVRQVVS